MKKVIIATPHSRYDEACNNITRELPDYQIVRIKDPALMTAEVLEKIKPEWIFFPHWSWKISHTVYEKFRCVIFHMTDLPFGRGGSPLQNLIICGYSRTKLSAIKCDREIDAGAVYAKRDLSLEGDAEEILRRAAILIEELVVWIVRNNPAAIEQTGEITRFIRRNPEEGNLSQLCDLSKVFDYIRMLDADGYPHAFINSERLKFEFTGAKLENGFVRANVKIRVRQDV